MHALSVSLSLTLRALAIQTRELRRGETNVWLSLNLGSNFAFRFHSSVTFSHNVFSSTDLTTNLIGGTSECSSNSTHTHLYTASLLPHYRPKYHAFRCIWRVQPPRGPRGRPGAGNPPGTNARWEQEEEEEEEEMESAPRPSCQSRPKNSDGRTEVFPRMQIAPLIPFL